MRHPPARNLQRTRHPPLVIPTGAKRSGGTCVSTDPSWKCFDKANCVTKSIPAELIISQLAVICRIDSFDYNALIRLNQIWAHAPQATRNVGGSAAPYAAGWTPTLCLDPYGKAP